MALITYADKQPLGEQPSIPEVNKVTADNMNEIKNAINGIFNYIYPVGSIYMSVSSTNPGTIFGGTWEQIQDKFLLACGNTYANGSTGGEATHTLTTNEMPSHRHERVRDLLNNQLLGEAGGTINNVAGLAYNTGKYAYTDTTHNNVVTDYTGGGQAHNNMPPYFAVYIWKRTA